MMMRAGEATAVVRSFFDAYLVGRDAARTLSHLSEGVYWVGTGKNELACGRAEVERALRGKFAQEEAPYNIVYEKVEETIISACTAVVLLTATVTRGGEKDTWLRATAACTKDGDGPCRIFSIHTSASDRPEEDGGFFPAPSLGRMELDRRLGARALDILGKSIPGGMMGGYLEPDFPLYYVNDAMLCYLGYTYEEFVCAIGGKVINCMHPDDRERVDTLVARAFGQGAEYEVQYRMQKKDGSYIWVNDIGKKGLSEDGRAVCISVIRDISAQVQAQQRLQAQAAEQKRLAMQYDNLFQSVLCGIVQYRQTESGVVFVNANREAIRIFGYQPQEFWAKREWGLADLVAQEDREYILRVAMKLRQPGDKSGYEYRVLQKGGTTCWILGTAEIIADSDGNGLVQSVYLDIDGHKKAQERNQLLAQQVEASNRILHLALEHTTTCEFYYYPQAALCLAPARTCEIFHSRERYEDMPGSFAVEQVDEAYRPAFYGMYERIHRGERTASCEYRRLGGEFWCRETLSVILTGEDGAPQLAVGIIENITRQKRAEEALQEARSRDSLTGLYNKEAGIPLVQEYLAHGRKNGEHCVMMLLDMDDFEDINQKEGKVFADAVLQEVADILRAETGPGSIQIRLGGDEFMLLAKGCGKARAVVIGPRIAGLVQNILENTGQDIHVSVSIGMCSTEVVEDYNGLYRCAESTLKYVKEHGKGQAACYLDTSNELGVYLTQLYMGEHPVNAIGQEDLNRPADLISFALDLLGKAKNLDDAVFLLLARIGKLYGFDRVSIIEASREYLTYRFSYQWARNRADLQLGQDFYVSDEDFETCIHMYDGDGLADHNVREGISRFPSCLHAGIWDYGEYAGSMSFEVDRPGYQWTPQQRSLLKELVRIVPSFIMKSKADALSKAKTDFLSRMSHEIRTPMNAISGMTTIAKSVLDDKGKALECLEKIESANGYLLSLINDILDMSRIESGKLELSCGPLDLAGQLSSLESLFRAQATQKGLWLRFIDGRRENRPLWADGLRLNQVLVNIIGNAIKFTQEGGVTVRVEEIGAGPEAVLRFSVEDTGIGIDASACARIFNAFEQAEKDTASHHGGTGLGLSISSRLVQMMGGALEVRSEAGKGSAFFFTLSFKYAPGAPPAAAPEAPAPSLAGLRGRHILLVEDNALNREIAQALLEMNGFTVACAADGQEALDTFCAGDPGQFDAVLMDIRMPVMDGLEATRRMRTCGRPDARTVPIIALTANAFDEDTKKSMASGMNGHLSKPIQIGQMLEVLARCIGQRPQTGNGAP